MLEPFKITHFYSDGWGAYECYLDAAIHLIGKCNTQKIERKPLTLRTQINGSLVERFAFPNPNRCTK